MLILCNVYRDSKKNMLRISGKNIAMVQMKHCDDSSCSLRWVNQLIALWYISCGFVFYRRKLCSGVEIVVEKINIRST